MARLEEDGAARRVRRHGQSRLADDLRVPWITLTDLADGLDTEIVQFIAYDPVHRL